MLYDLNEKIDKESLTEKQKKAIEDFKQIFMPETPEFQEMWAKNGRRDEPRLTDITIGVLDRKYVVRFHPTPYGIWHHLYDVGHFIEMELESLGYGVGPLGKHVGWRSRRGAVDAARRSDGSPAARAPAARGWRG